MTTSACRWTTSTMYFVSSMPKTCSRWIAWWATSQVRQTIWVVGASLLPGLTPTTETLTPPHHCKLSINSKALSWEHSHGLLKILSLTRPHIALRKTPQTFWTTSNSLGHVIGKETVNPRGFAKEMAHESKHLFGHAESQSTVVLGFRVRVKVRIRVGVSFANTLRIQVSVLYFICLLIMFYCYVYWTPRPVYFG